MESNNNPAPPKKPGSRKKLVDLKAVAALLEDSEGETGKEGESGKESEKKATKALFEPDEELIQSTARVKSQRDLIRKRLQKMDQGRDRVSKTVFDKVYRDYSMQLETINKLLNEKKQLLEKELQNLYMLREKQDIDINRHKEILEEARFRHYLEEYSEEQYKEVEDYESKEILNLQSELSQLQSYIKTHEELFDPEDLGYESKEEAPKTSPKAPEQPTRTEPTKTTPPPQMRTPVSPPTSQEWIEKTPPPTKKEEVAKETTGPQIKTSTEAVDEEEVLLSPDEGGYFEAAEAPSEALSEPSISKTEKMEPSLTQSEKPAPLGETTDSTSTATPSAPAAKAKEPESILDILEEAPPKAKTAAPPPPPPPSTPQPAAGKSGGYKIVFLEGEVESPEFELKENISLGRSPSNDLVLKAAKVSRQHAAINKYKDQYIIIDLKSSNGVFVNGKKVDEHTLKEGDQITIGGYKMVFQKV